MSNYLFPKGVQVQPWSNVDGNFVNKYNTNWPGSFGSVETSRQFGLPGVSSNVHAASASKVVGGFSKKKMSTYNKMRTGKRYAKRHGKIHRKRRTVKRIMPYVLGGKRMRTSKQMKHGLKRYFNKTRITKRNQLGGYSQYMNNIPNTPSYSTGGVISAANLALANPAPYTILPTCTNCVDNYNYYTNKGFQV